MESALREIRRNLPVTAVNFSWRASPAVLSFHGCPGGFCPSMNEHDLQRMLRGARETPPDPGLAEAVLARLPRVRFVRPGSDPGGRALLLAGLLGIGAAAAVAGLMSPARPPEGKSATPPPWHLFQTADPAPPRPAGAAGFP